MSMLRIAFNTAIGYVFIGGLVMAGMKAVDWSIPNPPRPLLKVQLECGESEAALIPNTDGKRSL